MKKRLIWLILALAVLLSSCAVAAATPNNATESNVKASAETQTAAISESPTDAPDIQPTEPSTDDSFAETADTMEELSSLHEEVFEAFLEACTCEMSEQYDFLGQVGDHSLIMCCSKCVDWSCVNNVYAGYRIYSGGTSIPSDTGLYLVTDDAVYTLSAAYRLELFADMGDVYDLLPSDMQAGFDPSAQDSYGGLGKPVELKDGVYW